MAERFSARIRIVGINPCVDVPLRVSRALEGTGYIPVEGTVNGEPTSGTLVPVGKGRYRFFINGAMRERTGTRVGDTISVALKRDNRPRVLPIPKGLKAELRDDRTLRKAWEGLTPSRRKEILAYLNSAKRAETLRKNVARVVSILAEKSRQEDSN
ncbi:MAG TPA: YdeI/OmpD-associated family protein [Bacteroidota bacterium]|nr:YdeI/OmpD-associated family protein [Bacteroidota bacterium]